MDHLRWLLVMEKQTDPTQQSFAYKLWLYELDEASERPPISCTTVDDLMAALVARWDQGKALPTKD